MGCMRRSTTMVAIVLDLGQFQFQFQFHHDHQFHDHQEVALVPGTDAVRTVWRPNLTSKARIVQDLHPKSPLEGAGAHGMDVV